MGQSLANGQLAASSGTVLGAETARGAERVVNVNLANTSASTTETVLLTVSRNGGTARRLDRIVLAPNESAKLLNVALDPPDVLAGSSTNATTVDYDITISAGGPRQTVVYDANGSLKSGSASLSGALTVTGTLTVQDTVFLRDGNAPVTKLTASAITTAGAGTYTAAHILGGLILRDPNGAGRTDTTATAAQLVAALSGAAVDDTVPLTIVNTADAAETITLAGGSGVTLVPATITIAQNEIFHGLLRFTNVTASSEACTLYGGNVAG